MDPQVTPGVSILKWSNELNDLGVPPKDETDTSVPRKTTYYLLPSPKSPFLSLQFHCSPYIPHIICPHGFHIISLLFLQNFPIIHPFATIMESFFITSIHVHQKTSDFSIVSHKKLGQLDLPTSKEAPSSRPWCIICRRVLAKRKIPAASVLLTQSPEGVERAKCQSVAWQSWR